MKNARVWFEKDRECKYISHLDLNRVMLRAVQKSKIPVWHTEGFNPHPFITFALPLSLGFRGKRESMDFKLTDELYPLENIPAALNACLPGGIRVYGAFEPVMKPGAIAFAKFVIDLESGEYGVSQIMQAVKNLLAMDCVTVEKKTKSGQKQVDIRYALENVTAQPSENAVRLTAVLPAGSADNVNPSLIISALERYFGIKPLFDITRECLYDAQVSEFV